MERGFPRPRIEHGVTTSNPYMGRNGSYGKKWENRSYPVPYTASDTKVSNIDAVRLNESINNKVCGTCGDPVEEDLVGLIIYNDKARLGSVTQEQRNGWLHRESGPYHLKCLALNFTMCPMLAETKLYAPAVGLWSEVKDDIYRADS